MMGLGLIGLTVQLIGNPSAIATLAAVASGVVLLAGCIWMARNRHLDLAAWSACATILATLGFMGAMDTTALHPIWPALLLAAPLTAATALKPRDVLTVSLAAVLTILAAAALNPTLQSASFLISVLVLYGVIPPLIWLVARPALVAADAPPIPPRQVTDARPVAASGSASIDEDDPLALLEETTADLRRDDKMEGISIMAGGLAHDFNNILTVVMTNLALATDIVSEEERDDPELADCLDDANMATTQAASLTQRLLVFARGELSSPELLNPAEHIRAAASFLRPVLPGHIQIESDASHVTGAIYMDSRRFDQILLNLAFNARDAMPQGGNLRISAHTDDEGSLRLEVSDTGVGIHDELLDKIFEPFFTTKGGGQGAGLGLTTVRRVIEEAKGTVTAQSVVGEGTTFSISIPKHDPDTVQARPSNASPHPVDRSGALLLCEDDPGIRHAMVNVLESNGFTVHAGATPSETLTLAATLERVDAIISDVVLPEMKGPQLIERLKVNFPDAGSLLISGYAPSDILGDVSGYVLLQKPFSPDALLQRLDEVLMANPPRSPAEPAEPP